MAIDTSIYQTIKQPEIASPMDMMTKAMTLSHLSRQIRAADQTDANAQALKGIYANASNLGQNGRLNQVGLSALAKLDPSKALETQQAYSKLETEDLANKANAMKYKINAWGAVAQMAADAKDQADWNKTMQTANKAGLDTSIFGDQFNPQNAQKIARMGFDAVDRQKAIHDQIQDTIAQQKAPLENAKTIAETKHATADTAKSYAETDKIRGETIKRNPDVLAQSNDPAKLVPGMVPKEHQAKAFGEIDAAENTKHMAGSIMDSFEQAVRDTSGTGAVTSVLKDPRSVLALHQAMQPTFKDLEGTVRQAAMDNTFHNITPHFADTVRDTEIKRKALEDYLQSKSSAPVARAYGIDLGKYASTAPYQGAPRKTADSDGGLTKSAYASDKAQGNYRPVGAQVSADEVSKYATRHGMKRADAESYLKGQGYAIGN